MSGILQGFLASFAASVGGFTLFTWGRGTDGPLGDGTIVSRSSPVQVGALTNWAQVSASYRITACTQVA